MKFYCEKDIIQNAINTVQKATSTKTTYPILEGILINAKDNTLKFTATDLDLGIETYINANVVEEGSIVVKSSLFGEIIRKLPNDTVMIETNGNNIIIKCQKSEFMLVGNNYEDFPKLPTINENSMYEISQDVLKNMIRQTIFATNISAVIPGKTLNEISKILEVSDEKVKITFTPNHILFNLGNTKIISRLLDGEFINYRQIIPDEYNLRAKVKTNELLDSIERASLLAREGKTNLIKFNILDKQIIVTSNSQMGKVNEEVEIELEGQGIKIAFNSKYFIDVLRTIDSEEIYLEFSTSVSPCLVKKVGSNDYIYLVLPVRLVDND